MLRDLRDLHIQSESNISTNMEVSKRTLSVRQGSEESLNRPLPKAEAELRDCHWNPVDRF
jgi:hypothetical protein